jgi:hypothetical protein
VPGHEVLTVKKLQLKPTTTTTTTTTTLIEENKGEEEVVVEDSPQTVKKLQYPPEKRPRTVGFLQFEEKELSTAVDNFMQGRISQEHPAAHQALIEAGMGRLFTFPRHLNSKADQSPSMEQI